MRLIWLSYFDPRKDNKTVWWCRGDSTDAGMTTPCRDRGAPRMRRPFKGRFMSLEKRYQLLLMLKFFISVTFTVTVVLEILPLSPGVA